jgi:hypothetical protein
VFERRFGDLLMDGRMPRLKDSLPAPSSGRDADRCTFTRAVPANRWPASDPPLCRVVLGHRRATMTACRPERKHARESETTQEHDEAQPFDIDGPGEIETAHTQECRDCQRFERKLVGCMGKVLSLIPGASSLTSNQIFTRRLRSSIGAELCCSH